MAAIETDVLVAGGGPVGLVLAIDLARRGVDVTLVERNPAPTGHPKMERCNARTMEIFRRLGIAESVRAAGYPADASMDVFLVTRLTEPPVLHLEYPTVAESRARIARCRDGSLPLEPYQVTSQYALEPLLREIAEGLGNAHIRFGAELLAFAEEADGVTATCRATDKDSDGELTIKCKYLAGCDGGGSTVRRRLGIGLVGEGGLTLRQAMFRCDDLYGRIGTGKGRHYHVIDGRQGFVIVQGDLRHFTLHAQAGRDEDMAAAFEEIVGMPIDYEMVHVNEWTQRLLVAESYGTGRVFLAGDACHLMIPTGGLGMNTGVGDAVDLGWKLAASVLGWGGPKLLRSYDEERRPVGERNVGVSRRASEGRQRWRSFHDPAAFTDTPEGRAARERIARVADEEQRKTNEIPGAELGYIYSGSGIIPDPGAPAPVSAIGKYAPSAFPGARLPSTWLKEGPGGGIAVQDRCGPWFTVLRVGDSPPDAGPLARALERRGAPAAILDQPDGRAAEVYGASLLVLRPDLHVAWRGDAAPDDPEGIAAVVTGHG